MKTYQFGDPVAEVRHDGEFGYYESPLGRLVSVPLPVAVEMMRLADQGRGFAGKIILYPADGSAPLVLAPAQEGAQVIDAVSERSVVRDFLLRQAGKAEEEGALGLAISYKATAALIDRGVHHEPPVAKEEA